MTQEFIKANTLVLCISSFFSRYSVLVRVRKSSFNISFNDLFCIAWIFETLETEV